MRFRLDIFPTNLMFVFAVNLNILEKISNVTRQSFGQGEVQGSEALRLFMS